MSWNLFYFVPNSKSITNQSLNSHLNQQFFFVHFHFPNFPFVMLLCFFALKSAPWQHKCFPAVYIVNCYKTLNGMKRIKKQLQGGLFCSFLRFFLVFFFTFISTFMTFNLKNHREKRRGRLWDPNLITRSFWVW